jgi:peptidoglycan/LPS O-acetylase OafA/YrhL
MKSLLRRLDLGGEKYPALTGVRALGASVVFFDHFPPLPNMHVTVNVLAFFFALSGFLIVRVYYAQVQLSSQWLAKYFINRFARIYPVYFLLLTIGVFLQGGFRHPLTLLANYTLTHALFRGVFFFIQPSWSLTVEECFYVLAPLFMLLARRYTFLAPFAVATALLGVALGISRLGLAFLGTPMFVLSMTFFGHYLEFFAGVWLALRVMRLERAGVLRTPGNRRTLAGVAAVAVLIVAMMIVYDRQPLNLAAVLLLNNFLIPLPIVLLYSGLIREDTLFARWLSGRTMALLGRSSYSFYLLHTLMIQFVLVHWFPVASHRLLCVLGGFVLTWAVSVALFLAYEEPINLFIRHRFKSKAAWVGLQTTLFPAR